jgi:hypothetical protein
VVRIANENPGWGYDRIVGAMANLGFRLSNQTVANIPGCVRGRLEVVVLLVFLSLLAQFGYWLRIVNGLNREHT